MKCEALNETQQHRIVASTGVCSAHGLVYAVMEKEHNRTEEQVLQIREAYQQERKRRQED